MRAAPAVCGALVELFECVDLRLREAIEFIVCLAEQHGGIEVALRGIVDEAVFDAVGRVAGVERCFLNCRQLEAGDVAARVCGEILHSGDAGGEQA